MNLSKEAFVAVTETLKEVSETLLGTRAVSPTAEAPIPENSNVIRGSFN
jgi:hypothetical protein